MYYFYIHVVIKTEFLNFISKIINLINSIKMPLILNETQLYEEYNHLSSFELCYHGQELVQEFVNKIAETVQLLRQLSVYLLHSDHNSYLQRRIKLEELFGSFESFLKRLRIISHILTNRKSELDTQINSMPRDPIELNQELEQLNKQKLDLQEQIKNKNSYLKLSIDKLTDIIWNINSIQSIKQQY